MKHSQFEHWILDDIALSVDQGKSLEAHLTGCKECRQLKTGWDASRNLLTTAILASPAPGFTIRWQDTIARKYRLEKVRRFRLTLAGLLMLAFAASLTYMVASGSFLHILANFFTSIAQLVIAITNGLSTLGYWISRMPLAVTLTAGFMLFGMLTAFILTTAFTLWNVNNRKQLAHEIVSD